MSKKSFDLSGRDVDMEIIEDLTRNAKQIQDDILEEIVTSNMNTEYLRRFLDGDRFDKELFKKNVPVVTYEDIKPYIERIKNGEPSHLISAKPIEGFFRSSGTSGGVQKLMPMNNKYFENFKFINNLRMLITTKHVDGADQGKGMMFFFVSPEWKTPSGLLIKSSISSYFKSDYFKNRPSNFRSCTSPNEVILCPDEKQSLYCHLLCGLLLRDEVRKVGSGFASGIIRAIKFLEYHWKELCSNIRAGQVSDWITDIGCRNSVSMILENPRPELADLVEQECNQKSWEGIITKLWPNTKYIATIVTGSAVQYIQSLNFYSNNLPILSTLYASSETMFGINLDPLCKPQDISYTFMPNMSYFEFLPVGVNFDEIVDLVDVKLGCYYEPVVTNFLGLYRIRVGDILLVTGFYNNAPQFRFIRRENVVLSIDDEKTTEEDLFKGVNRAKLILDASDLMLVDFTSYADISTAPGHYVLYWELKAKDKDVIPKLDHTVLSECCFAVEESLDALYKRYRSEDGPIGALEVKVVQHDTFDSLMDFFVSQGAAVGQYKTPSCIRSAAALELLEKRVVRRFFSQKRPSWDSTLYPSST